MKKFLRITLIMFLTLFILFIITKKTNLLTVKTSSKGVNVGDYVTYTIPFDKKVSAAQFKLNYDKNKLTYVSFSCEGMCFFAPETNKFAFASEKEVLDKVTFTFKAKKAGKVTIKVSNFKTSNMNESKPSNKTVTIIDKAKQNKASKTSSNSKKTMVLIPITFLIILFAITVVIIIKKNKENKSQVQ